MAYIRKTKSKKEVGYLLSNSSPLTLSRKMQLNNEITMKTLKIRKRQRLPKPKIGQDE